MQESVFSIELNRTKEAKITLGESYITRLKYAFKQIDISEENFNSFIVLTCIFAISVEGKTNIDQYDFFIKTTKREMSYGEFVDYTINTVNKERLLEAKSRYQNNLNKHSYNIRKLLFEYVVLFIVSKGYYTKLDMEFAEELQVK